MTRVLLVFPHQLFADHPGLDPKPDQVVLLEDPLFFDDPAYPARMHKQKLWLHMASMAQFADRLKAQGHVVQQGKATRDAHLIDTTMQALAQAGCTTLVAADPVDHAAMRRLRRATDAAGLILNLVPSPGFLNTRADNSEWSNGRKRWFMAEFYKHQRTRLDILMENGTPQGGKWSFDEDNRKKVPKAMMSAIPDLPEVPRSAADRTARDRVLADYPDAPGVLDRLYYPTTHAEAARWLDLFLAHRLSLFGDYEDAIVVGQSWLWHSVLTPMLNIGLLTPQQVVTATLDHANRHDVPLNALEGFLRQIIGWREFMRATYEDLGVPMRTTNHWAHHRTIPHSFYDATTGIDPLDDVIRRVLRTGYCHHIERLMVVGGFMFLCEIDPDDVYRWFMEMFVDSYDWVMVPNAYAMSQNADGGLITTKPYFSGSNYIRKMSNWPTGPWCEGWDGLYWRFIWRHRESLAKNPRWSFMVAQGNRMAPEKRAAHLHAADTFLDQL